MINYVGQLRIYSLVDYILLLTVAGATGTHLIALVVLHVSFLAWLEAEHRHSFREEISHDKPIAACACAGLMYGEDISRVWYYFMMFSGLYAMKNRGSWGLFSPVARGMQTLVILLLFLPLTSPLLWVAATAMFLRNLLGDFRDVEQDSREEMQTWPVALGVRHDWLFLHIAATIGTTWLWWGFSSLPAWVPAVLTPLEIGVYWLTPRASNKKATDRLRQILQSVWR